MAQKTEDVSQGKEKALMASMQERENMGILRMTCYVVVHLIHKY